MRPQISFSAIDDILVSNDRWDGVVHGYGSTPRDYFTVVGSFVTCEIPWNGQVLEANTIICAAANSEWSFHTPNGTNHWVIFIPTQKLAQYLGPEAYALHGETGQLLKCSRRQFLRMGALVKRILAGPQHTEPAAQALVAAQQFEARILAEVADLLGGSTADQAPTRVHKRNAVYQSAIRYVTASGPPDTVQALASAVGVSLRVLQLAFQENLGQSPHHYLQVCRLNILHSKLRLGVASEATVTQAMAALGITQYGRVAGQYEQLFGELPSATLCRLPDPGTESLNSALPRRTSPA